MPELEVRLLLPYYLRVEPGAYEIGGNGQTLHIGVPELIETGPPRNPVLMRFTHENTDNADVIQGHKARDVNRLLFSSNQLLRWYRSITHRSDILDMARAQASPFTFRVVNGEQSDLWEDRIEYEVAMISPIEIDVAETSNRIREALSANNEPDVAELFLLDAERSLNEGRFRETVLFCWSTIDSVFNAKYNRIAASKLTGEWADSLKFFTGVDFGIKNKMTAALFLMTGKSVFRQSEDLWQNLVTSYTKRNEIIHRGQNASEDDALRAFSVAQRIVVLMNEIEG